LPIESRFEYEQRQSREAWRRAELETHPADKRRWLERALRFTPSDQNLAFAVAEARLMDGDADAAMALFGRIAARHAVREVLCGLAASALLAGARETAVEAIGKALSGFAVEPTVLAIAARCATSWCGLTAEGRLVMSPGRQPQLTLDGQPIRLGNTGNLPRRWRSARFLAVTQNGETALGSPIDLAALRRIEGFAERSDDGVAGWAWHPGAPETDPVLAIEAGETLQQIKAEDRSVAVSGASPLARPRGFAVRVAPSQPVRVLDHEGRDVWGSPLVPEAPPAPAPRPRRGEAVTVVVPVYRGRDTTLACLRSVLDTVGPKDRVVAVNDASPEPDLVAALTQMAGAGKIRLVASCATDATRNVGFPAAANAGIRAALGSDVVLLNSDTLVFPGWLEELRGVACNAPDIGTVTPLSNDASIFTYPEPGAPAAIPDAAEGGRLAKWAAHANTGLAVDMPTGHGFCLYIRAACLHAVGLLREDLFAQGYGEENDFCERARAKGWRHVAAPGVYVAHVGGASFGASRNYLLRRNAVIMDRLHPDYHARVQAFIAADGLAEARRRLDVVRWRAAQTGRGRRAVLLVTHDGSGGTGRVVRERAAAIRQAGRTPVVLGASEGVTTVDAADGFTNLRYRTEDELAALSKLLAHARPEAAEIHHLLGHNSAVTALPARFGIPYDVWVHDWQWICPRLACMTPEGFYCGEPPARECDACTSRGEPPAIAMPAADVRARSAALLSGARKIVVATQDAASRLRRHFPALTPDVVPWEPDPAPPPDHAAPRHRPGWLCVAVIGALGLEKGYDVLLACARDAAARDLHLRFTVVGYTVDDGPLLETGRVFVTGPFAAGEAGGLLAQSGASLAFIPSIWPETWCFALSDAWDCGLDAAVFDIGAPAERVRRTGRGWVLPLNLPAAAVNDALLRLQGVAVRSG
jgi:GT2 family glycosyltransferase/glycosyltransferase involved in cell wall biosynthesis